jgi:hypothetical protein
MTPWEEEMGGRLGLGGVAARIERGGDGRGATAKGWESGGGGCTKGKGVRGGRLGFGKDSGPNH